MKTIAWMLCLFFCSLATAQETADISAAQNNTVFASAVELFAQGKYQTVIDELKEIEQKFSQSKGVSRQLLGFVAYWKGICYNRSQDYPGAIESFDRALSHDYSPLDLNYEYGQALFASEKLAEARIQFRESLKKKFKRGVSLYYIAFISKELGQNNKAFTFFRAIEKLEEGEAFEVRQAAEMQIGDIYLEQVEKRIDAFRTVETYVIPQYERALALNPDSPLGPVIREKIVKLQRKYDLVLFQLRNGRPALIPPYFLRIAQEFGQDTNVTFSPAETTISKSKQASAYSRTDVVGRYTFYVDNYFSIAPEFRANLTHYFNRVPEIYRNDNYLLAPAIRTAYEHTFRKKPASFLVDYDFSEARRDVNAREEFDFNSRTHAFMVGERFNFFSSGESVARLRYRILDSFLSDSDSTSTSFVFEQVMSLGSTTLLFYGSYDMMRVKNEAFDTNALTFRTDLILPRFEDWFTPSLALSLTSTDPINNRSARGRELLLNPSVRLSRTFAQRWRSNLKYEYQRNKSDDKSNFDFTKSIYAVEFEYLF